MASWRTGLASPDPSAGVVMGWRRKGRPPPGLGGGQQVWCRRPAARLRRRWRRSRPALRSRWRSPRGQPARTMAPSPRRPHRLAHPGAASLAAASTCGTTTWSSTWMRHSWSTPTPGVLRAGCCVRTAPALPAGQGAPPAACVAETRGAATAQMAAPPCDGTTSILVRLQAQKQSDWM